MIPENLLPVDTASSYVISHSLLWKWSRQQKHAPSAKREKRMNQKTILGCILNSENPGNLWYLVEPMVQKMAHFPTKITAISPYLWLTRMSPIAFFKASKVLKNHLFQAIDDGLETHCLKAKATTRWMAFGCCVSVFDHTMDGWKILHQARNYWDSYETLWKILNNEIIMIMEETIYKLVQDFATMHRMLSI